jgi:hypothetical protein
LICGRHALAAQDKFQFQGWAFGFVGTRRVEEKKGADKGIRSEKKNAASGEPARRPVAGGGVETHSCADFSRQVV